MNWTEFAALATAGSAFGTFVAASFTGWMAHKTSRMVTATEDDARASRESVEEIRRSRELDWRPFLSLGAGRVPEKDAAVFRVAGDVVNVGRGPALYCSWGYTRSGRWAITLGKFTLAPGEVRGVTFGEIMTPVPEALFAINGKVMDDSHVLVCRDGILGAWYRFLPTQGTLDRWDFKGESPDWFAALARLHRAES
ncbi:MAG: hypothetical protein ACYCZN_09250 [Candidatus Dormibacteria bacterium]